MADTVDPERRSQIMSRIRSRDTLPERTVRSLAHRLGYRFRLHRKGLPGRPDLVFVRHQLAVFVHGCFWHRHAGCTNCTTPKTRADFWQRKFEGNMARDRRNCEDLTRLGWKSLVIWECETEDPARLRAILAKALTPRRKRAR